MVFDGFGRSLNQAVTVYSGAIFLPEYRCKKQLSKIWEDTMRADSARQNAMPREPRSYLTSVALSVLMLGDPAVAQDTPRDGGNITVHINRDLSLIHI